jgi:hypothetical protein
MMIDIEKETGALRLHQSFVKKIDPTTELKELKRTIPSWEQTGYKNGRIALRLEMQSRHNDEILDLTVYFTKSKLSSIELSFSGVSIGDKRGQWSKAREMRRKKFHDSLFSSVLGKNEWGSVQSVLGKNAENSYVRLEYSDLST